MENNGHGEFRTTEEDHNTAPKAALIEAVSIRSMSLIVLASIATLVFIDWAQAVLLPLMVAVLISYALDPLVSALDHLKIPRPLSAAIILTLLLGAAAGASIPLQTEAIAILDKVPVAISKFQRNEANAPNQEESIMEKAQAAAKQIEESTEQGKKQTTRAPKHNACSGDREANRRSGLCSQECACRISACFPVFLGLAAGVFHTGGGTTLQTQSC